MAEVDFVAARLAADGAVRLLIVGAEGSGAIGRVDTPEGVVVAAYRADASSSCSECGPGVCTHVRAVGRAYRERAL